MSFRLLMVINILGLDFLSKYQAVINCGTGLLEIQGQTLPLDMSKPKSLPEPNVPLDLIVLKDTTIEPSTQTVLILPVKHPNSKSFDRKAGAVLPKVRMPSLAKC